MGLEIEAGAFLKLCKYANISSLGIVKGISDFGNDEKGKGLALYNDALRNSAIALRDWVTNIIPAITWQTDQAAQSQIASKLNSRTQPESGLGAEFSRSYYKNFVSVVLDAYRQGQSVKLKTDPTVRVSLCHASAERQLTW
jgi:hypothetical protein